MPYVHPETVQLQYNPTYDYSGGMVTNYNFTLIKKNQLLRALNCDLITDGSITKRKGRNKQNSVAVSGNSTINSLFVFNQAGGADQILGSHDTRFSSFPLAATPVLIRSGLANTVPLSGSQLDNFLFLCNGVDRPFMTNGVAAGTYFIGLNPVTGPQYAAVTAAAAPGGNGSYNGALPFPGRHRIQFRYRSTITGARSQPAMNGDIPAFATFLTFTPGNQTYQITIGAAAVNADPQVDAIDIFAQEESADVDAPYFFLGTMPNAIGVSFFSVGVSDLELMVKERLDIDDLPAPNNCRWFETWQGRMFAITGDYTVNFSKQRIADDSFINLPTSWPGKNELDVGFGDGDPLVRIIQFYDYIFAFKKRSVWILNGTINSANFGFKRLKANYSNIGLLNPRSIVQAGNSIYFVTDDLKFTMFSATDFSTEELRLPDRPLSDPIADLFTLFASNYRPNVNLVNNTWGQYTQIMIAFSNGQSGLNTANNFNCFVYDYDLNAWTISTKIEIASSVLAKDSGNNYRVYIGDYYGYVWRLGDSDGDGAIINGTLASATGTTFVTVGADLPVPPAAPIDGTFITILDGLGAGQVRRVVSTAGTNNGVITSAFDVIPPPGSMYTIGGIDFEVQTRWDWCALDAPPEFDKYAWYLDIDFDFGFNPTVIDPIFNQPAGGGRYGYGIDVIVYTNRQNVGVTQTPRELVYPGSSWDEDFWDVGIWDDATESYTQVGLDLYFKQISVKLWNYKAGQPIKLNGHTWCFQNLEHMRPT